MSLRLAQVWFVGCRHAAQLVAEQQRQMGSMQLDGAAWPSGFMPDTGSESTFTSDGVGATNLYLHMHCMPGQLQHSLILTKKRTEAATAEASRCRTQITPGLVRVESFVLP